MSKKININDYLPELQTRYQKDILIKVVEVLQARGVPVNTEDEINRLFKDRIKGETFEGLTRLTLDGTPLCEYGQLHAEVKGTDIATSFKFREI